MHRLISHRATAAFAIEWIAAVAAPSASAQRASTLDPSARRDTSPPFLYPTGIALDAAGAVYVASAGDSSIAVFAADAAGAAGPVRRIGGPRSGLVRSQGGALDSRGRIYVASESRRIEGEASITVYPPGADGDAPPTRVIFGRTTELKAPTRLAAGADGRIYVVNGRGGILEFDRRAAGDAAPRRRIPVLADSVPPSDVAIGADGTLLVIDGEGLTVHRDAGTVRRPVVAKLPPRKPADGSPGWVLRQDPEDRPVERPLFALGPAGELYVGEMIQKDSSETKDGRWLFSSFFGRTPTVSVYADAERGDTAPVRKIVGPRAELFQIADIAAGRDGSLYVLSRGKGSSQGGRILVFAPDADGDVPAVRTIDGKRTGMTNATSLALDRRGRIYVTDDGNRDHNGVLVGSVLVFPPDAAGDAAPVRTIRGPTARLSRPADVAVSEDGAVYVANGGVYTDDHGSVRVYAAGAAWDEPPLRTIVGTAARMVNPGAVVLDRRDTLYVIIRPDFEGNRVAVYPPGAGAGTRPIRVLEGLTSWYDEAQGLALDAEGRLHVSDRRNASGVNAYGADLGAVRVYRAGAEGSERPIRTITGSHTRMNGPGGIAIDRAGNVYVPNRWGGGPGSVTVYGPSDSGDVRPRGIIAGPATGLSAPAAVSLDPHDTLYVVNSGTVTVYPPNATGNVPPVRTIGRPPGS